MIDRGYWGAWPPCALPVATRVAIGPIWQRFPDEETDRSPRPRTKQHWMRGLHHLGDVMPWRWQLPSLRPALDRLLKTPSPPHEPSVAEQ